MEGHWAARRLHTATAAAAAAAAKAKALSGQLAAARAAAGD